MARQTAAIITKSEYVVVNSRMKPDKLGYICGVTPTERDGKYYVRLSPSQAQWALEHGDIKPA